jgi:hypothetical protein
MKIDGVKNGENEEAGQRDRADVERSLQQLANSKPRGRNRLRLVIPTGNFFRQLWRFGPAIHLLIKSNAAFIPRVSTLEQTPRARVRRSNF